MSTTLWNFTILVRMVIRRVQFLTSVLGVASLVCALSSADILHAQENPAPHLPAIAALQLPAPRAAELQKAIDAHDYLTAEKILLAEMDRNPTSPSMGTLLDLAGSVYYLNHDYLNAAIAWKKSEAIAPLDPGLRFSLAMAYVSLHHPDWARPVLESLSQQDSHNALFPYWLGRLDYDAHQYKPAIQHFQHAIELDSTMARAYDNLGLCYYYENQNDLAIANYNKAIELDLGSQHPSPWPYLNLAITQRFLGQFPNAEANLHKAIELGPSLAPAHFQLGTLLEARGQLNEAAAELQEAARLDSSYPEPHIALSRIYRKLGQDQAAHNEVDTYQKLRAHPAQ